jgi:hypothetical protein
MEDTTASPPHRTSRGALSGIRLLLYIRPLQHPLDVEGGGWTFDP